MPGTATKKSMWPATSQQLKRMPRHIYYSLGTSAQTTLPIETNLLMSKTFAHSSFHQYGPDAVVGAFCGAPTAINIHHGCVQLEPMECFVLWNEARTRRITPCCRLNRTGPGPPGSHSSSFMTSLKVGQLHDLLNLGRVRVAIGLGKGVKINRSYSPGLTNRFPDRTGEVYTPFSDPIVHGADHHMMYSQGLHSVVSFHSSMVASFNELCRLHMRPSGILSPRTWSFLLEQVVKWVIV